MHVLDACETQLSYPKGMISRPANQVPAAVHDQNIPPTIRLLLGDDFGRDFDGDPLCLFNVAPPHEKSQLHWLDEPHHKVLPEIPAAMPQGGRILHIWPPLWKDMNKHD